METKNFISSNTSENDAPDREEVALIGGVECHYALKGNLNPTHPEQQDRASVFSLPNTSQDEFKGIIDDVFSKMKSTYDELKAANPDFVGDSCAIVMMFDRKTGKLAIGSKGDSEIYVLLRNKHNPSDVIMQRISSSQQKLFKKIPRSTMVSVAPNCVGYNFPVTWANHESWSALKIPCHVEESGEGLPKFELIDLPKLATDVIKSHHIDRPVNLQDYEISFVAASDGLLASDTLIGTSGEKQRLEGITKHLNEPKPNQAQAMLDYVSDTAMPDNMRSHDNLSAVVLHDIQIGSGNPLAVCICDGNHAANLEKVHDGSVAGQRMIEVFEQEMQKLLGLQTSATFHRDRVQDTANSTKAVNSR